MTVYVSKEYNDNYAYTEELVQLFFKKTDAENFLKNRIEQAYSLPWNQIPDEYGFDEDDIFEKDYVAIYNGSSTSFWIIEQKPII